MQRLASRDGGANSSAKAGRMGLVVLAKAEGLDLKGTVLGVRRSGEALDIVVSCDGDQRGRRAP